MIIIFFDWIKGDSGIYQYRTLSDKHEKLQNAEEEYEASKENLSNIGISSKIKKKIVN